MFENLGEYKDADLYDAENDSKMTLFMIHG